MPRALTDILVETIGPRAVKEFFANPDPDPTDPDDPPENQAKIAELVESTLWWLASVVPIEIRDTTSFSIPDTGMIQLGTGPGVRILKILRVLQNSRQFDEARQDWNQGTPGMVGGWYIRGKTFFAIGVGNIPAYWAMPFLSTFSPYYYYPLDGNLYLKIGPIEVHYYGVPTESQLAGNERLRRAVIDYAMGLAYDDMAARIISPRTVEMEGVPKVTENMKWYQQSAKLRKDQALSVVSGVSAVLL